jgi:hypothetical protein
MIIITSEVQAYIITPPDMRGTSEWQKCYTYFMNFIILCGYMICKEGNQLKTGKSI